MTAPTTPNAELAAVTIRAFASDENPIGFDLDVKAEVPSQDYLVSMLLLVVEKLTGVSTDTYVALVDECRRIAARESWHDCAHRADYASAAEHERECPAHGVEAPTYGKGCRCDYLGAGTPEHAPSALCRSLRPDAERTEGGAS